MGRIPIRLINNVFIGNNVKKTGGIRIINAGHIIRNNLLVGLKGDGFRGPIVVMNGVYNSPLNRYHQVKNVDIQNNTIINSGAIAIGEGKDDEKTLPPINTIIANNVIYNATSSSSFNFVDTTSGVLFKNNFIDSNDALQAGFVKTKINWKEVSNIPIPTLENNALLNTFKNQNSPRLQVNHLQQSSS